MSYNNKLKCYNCFKLGHTKHNCPLPITSYGIIGFKIINNKLFFLSIVRKNTYMFDNLFFKKLLENEIPKFLNYITNEEKENIKSKTFEELYLWNKNDINKKNNFYYNKELIIKKINEYESYFDEAERGFPKGKRSFNESEINAAIREFTEEANIQNNQFSISNIPPISEIFKGDDNKHYKNVYYIAEIFDNYEPKINYENQDNFCEVGTIEFLEVYDLLKKLRLDDIVRKKMILDIEFIIKKKFNIKK
jgi:8-oxo-dGTP pyrophosphatase MutT (NUDIX family)